MARRGRVEVMHGVNFDVLERRDSSQYGGLSLRELELQIEGFAASLGIVTTFFQTNSEGAFVERLHGVAADADALILNPGAWTHYAWAIHDALAVAGVPAVEVHLSDISSREPWRALSVIGELCIESVIGRGIEGYRIALERLADELGEGTP
jgi:3-dehydroquinate dehydratase II